MANSKSQQYEIIKNGPLCLDKYCADIVPFGQGFNKKNSPLLGGAITNVFSKKDAEKKNYFSDGKNEIYYRYGHLIVNGADYGTFNNQKYVINDITLNGNKLNKDNCLDYVSSSNYILKRGNTITVKVNGSQFTRTYDSTATYKIIGVGSEYFYLEYKRVYSGATFNVNLKVARNSSGFIYNADCITNVPNTLEDNIRVEFCEFDNKVYIYILCLDEEFEFSGGTHLEFDSRFSDGTRHISITWAHSDNNDYRCLLEFDKNNNYSVRTILLQYEIGFQPSNPVIPNNPAIHNITTTSFSVLYPVLSPGKITYNIINYNLQVEVTYNSDSSYSVINWMTYDIFTVNSGFRFLYKNVVIPGSGATTNEYTFDNTVAGYSNSYTDYYRFHHDIAGGRQAESYINSNFYCCYSRYNYDTINNLCHLMLKSRKANGLDIDPDYTSIIASDYLGFTESTYSYDGHGYVIGSSFGDGSFYKLPHYVSPTRSNVPNTKYNNRNFGIVLNETQLPVGISYADNYQLLGTIITPWNSIDTDMPVNLYYDVAYVDKSGDWKQIDIVEGLEVSLIGDFVLINTTSTYNAIIISKAEKAIWATDWSNRIVGYTPYEPTSLVVSFKGDNKLYFRENSAINSNWDIHNNIPSSFMSTLGLYLYSDTSVDINSLESLFTAHKISLLCGISNYLAVDIYIEAVGQTQPGYFLTEQNTVNSPVGSGVIITYEDSALSGTQWKPGDSIYYNPTIIATFNDTLQDIACLFYGDELYVLHYIQDGTYILLYAYTTNVENINDFFAIQGQPYIISNKKIYSYVIENEVVKLSNFICTITGLKFLTYTPSMAYFWSYIDSSIYSFSADNIIRKLYTATDITNINNAIYYPSCNMTAFSTNLGILCYHEDLGMFTIEVDNAGSGKLFLQPDGYITYSDNNSVVYYTLWFPSSDSMTWDKEDIKLSTKFYGLGSNLISITDTWYFRLFADKDLYEQMNIERSGKLKLSVDALTDKGISTETKEIDIKESDWDDLTDTLYIRYQPKLQRGVGISLNVESPFAISYLGLGNILETTQMSRPTMQA